VTVEAAERTPTGKLAWTPPATTDHPLPQDSKGQPSDNGDTNSDNDSDHLLEHSVDSMSDSDASEDEPLFSTHGNGSNMEIMFGRTYLQLKKQPHSDEHPDDRFATALITMFDHDIENAPDSHSRLRSLMMRRRTELKRSSKTQLRHIERKYRQLRRLGIDHQDRTRTQRHRVLRQYQRKKKRLLRVFHQVQQAAM
jgi:hypothetical protein